MKKMILMIAFSLGTVIVNAQDEKGIKFEQSLRWEQIKAKAKAENKYIFLDCYATWCAPCKQMDKEVYPLEKVGKYMNTYFISVKVQMDTSKLDNENVKNWYADAYAMQQRYNVASFPTYLFFSPEGKVVHRYSAAMSDSLFLQVAVNALSLDKQYYTLLESYQQGNKDYDKIRYLANVAKAIGDKDLTNFIAKDYICNYLNKLTEKELFLKKNLDFTISFIELLRSQDKYFNLFYSNGDKIDELVNYKTHSQFIVDNIITKEEINSRLWPNKKQINGKPSWDKLIAIITKKYNRDYAERTVINAQLRWYNEKKDWPELIKYSIKRVDKYGLDTVGIAKAFLNNFIWDVIFEHSSNLEFLNKGIKWMEIILESEPNDPTYLDTYANLLHKAGRTQDALKWEEKAVKLEKEKAVKDKRDPDNAYSETLYKMRKGEPTWAQNKY